MWGGPYIGHSCLGRSLGSGLSGLDFFGLLEEWESLEGPGKLKAENGLWALSMALGMLVASPALLLPWLRLSSFLLGVVSGRGAFPCFSCLASSSLCGLGQQLAAGLGGGFGCGCSGQRGGQLSLPVSDGGDSVFPATTACGNSEFPTGNKVQLQTESGPRADSPHTLRTELGALGAGCGWWQRHYSSAYRLGQI